MTRNPVATPATPRLTTFCRALVGAWLLCCASATTADVATDLRQYLEALDAGDTPAIAGRTLKLKLLRADASAEAAKGCEPRP